MNVHRLKKTFAGIMLGAGSFTVSAITLSNGLLNVSIDENTLRITALDQRNGEIYRQRSIEGEAINLWPLSGEDSFLPVGFESNCIVVPIGGSKVEFRVSASNEVLRIAATLESPLIEKLSNDIPLQLNFFLGGNLFRIEVFAKAVRVDGRYGCSVSQASSPKQFNGESQKAITVEIPLQAFLSYRNWLQGSATQLTAWVQVILPGGETAFWPEQYDPYDKWSRALFIVNKDGARTDGTAIQNIRLIQNDMLRAVFSADIAAMNQAGRTSRTTIASTRTRAARDLYKPASCPRTKWHGSASACWRSPPLQVLR